ncbi:MAG: ABC transporter ATP-binding protein/permease [Lachnospiraceae bacterium]|nr:ABC transporter ATP-binding protein/permease [Lachnospiraceae bacterium]
MMRHIKTFIKYILLYVKSFLFVWKASKRLTMILLALIPMQAVLPAVTLYLTNIIINQAFRSGSDRLAILLTAWGIVFIVGNLVSPLITYVQGQLTDRLTFRFNTSIMQQAEKLQTIDYYEDSAFYDKISLLGAESGWRPVNLIVFGTSLVSSAVSLLSMFGLLCSFQPVVAILLAAALIPQGILSYLIQQQAFETLMSGSEDSRKLAYYSEALLTAEYVKEVRLYGLYGFFHNKYKSAYLRLCSRVRQNRIRQCVLALVFLLLAGVVGVAGFGYITCAVAQKALEPGTILIYTSAIAGTIQGISRFVEDSSLLYDTLLYMSNLFEYLAIETAPGFDGTQRWKDFRQMRIEHLGFRYSQGENEVLRDVSFTVKKGEKIAIVGENGAGKSTLVKLLLRMYPQSKGTVCFDDTRIEEFDIEAYRGQFCAVFQDFAKFDLTLQENVTLAQDTSDSVGREVLEALRQSGFWDDMTSDIPLEKMLGKRFEDARELSGGQWQKLALARAFYKDADILILDEPTSALDPKIETLLLDKFLELSQNKTVLFITHRLASVRNADKVLVLKNGEVSGFDTHQTLMQTNAYYRELYQSQAAKYLKS